MLKTLSRWGWPLISAAALGIAFAGCAFAGRGDGLNSPPSVATIAIGGVWILGAAAIAALASAKAWTAWGRG